MSDELTSILMRPIPLEEKTGFRNLAVMGGLGRYFLSFLEKAEKAGEISPETRAEADKLAHGYETATISERKSIIAGMKRLLSGGKVRGGPKKDRAAEKTAEAKASIASRALSSIKGKNAEESDIQYAKGVGPSLGSLLRRMGINRISDLLSYYPRRYDDRSYVKKIADLQDGDACTVLARVISKREMRTRGGMTITKVLVTDSSGAPLTLVWFNQPFRGKSLKNGDMMYASGKAEFKMNSFEMNSPETEAFVEEAARSARIVPVYPLSENLSQRTIRKIIKTNLDIYADSLEDPIPERTRAERNLRDYSWAIRNIHFPESPEAAAEARRRLAYDELFFFQLRLAAFRMKKEKIPKNRTYDISPSILDEFKKGLPFSLTRAQERSIREIMMDLASPHPMSRLVQGDVGSGKTMVAAAAAFTAARSGFQAAIMAPTEILAGQHYKKFSAYLSPYGIKTALLTGSSRKREREESLAGLADGSIEVAIGTHALIQEGVEFKRLGLAIVDEQHRFGVMQRTSLQRKGENPDMLVMTATPIPRTLSLTLYGDMDISVIDELPPGRKPVKSFFCPMEKIGRVWEYIRREVGKGRQAYVVCPLVDESDKVEAKAAITQAEELKSGVFADLRVSLLHGRMKPAEKDEAMEKFRSGRTDVLISTTVIEVGVDVPNATVMVIMNSERFGLAQLHQLRGRIGRGSADSVCFFAGDAEGGDSAERMRTMVSESDGFKIAQKDLELRGPGDFCGTRQHGLPEFRAADIVSDSRLLEDAKSDAEAALKRDPSFLERPAVERRARLIFSNPNEIIN